MKRSNFGQLMALFDTVNMGIHAGAQFGIQRTKVKGEQKLARQELEMQERLQTMGIAFKDKQLASTISISQRRDKLFKDIALYATIGIGAIALFITLGILFVSIKREEKYEYVLEES
jgi:hypothetical protein